MAMEGHRVGHSKRLRYGRWSEAGRLYLVTTAVHRRRKLFADWRPGRMVVRALMAERQAVSLCFVVMPDHFHWLLELGEGISLATVVGRAKSQSARWVNRQLNLRGPVWQEGFHDHAVRREEDLHTLARYVVANPVRAGLVRSVKDYPLWDAVWL